MSTIGNTLDSLRPVRLVAAAVLGLLLCFLLALQYSTFREWRGRQVGVILAEYSAGVFVESVTSGLPADLAGLRLGDRLAAINGRPVRTLDDYDAAAVVLRRGQPVPFTIMRGSAELIVDIRPGGPFPWIGFNANVMSVAAYLAIALLAMFRGLRDLRLRLLFLLSVAVAIEMALPIQILPEHAWRIWPEVIFYLLSGIEFGVELHLAGSIPDRHPWLTRWPWLVTAFYFTGGFVGCWAAGSYLNSTLDWGLDFFSVVTRGAILDLVLFPVWTVGLLLLLASQALRHPTPLGRHQAGLVLLGVLPWTMLAVFSTSLHALDLPTPAWVDIGWALTILPLPLTVFIAMFRYHLFDIQLVVRKGILYSAITGSLLVLFYALLGAGSFMLSRVLLGDHPSVLLVSASALLLGLLFQPIRLTLQRLIDRRFFPERQAFRQRLITLAGELPAQGKLPLMGEHLVTRLQDIFALRSATLLIADKDSGLLQPLARTREHGEAADDEFSLISLEDPAVSALARARKPLVTERLGSAGPSGLARIAESGRAALVVPMFARDRLSGLLLIGEKKDHEKFRAEEVELLDFLSHHVATVLENAKLFESATFDGLTGILRREAVLDRLLQEVRRALRYRRPLTVGMADLDHFKTVNDTFGHLAGDAALKRVASNLSNTLRGADFVGRYGGEEFLLVFPETDPSSALEVAQRIRLLVESQTSLAPGGEAVAVTISIGLAELSFELENENQAMTELIRLADLALYHAKETGRNQVMVAAASVSPDG